MLYDTHSCVYKSFDLLCGWTAWVRESELNEWLAERKLPYNSWVWIDKGNRFDRYLGYESYKVNLTA